MAPGFHEVAVYLGLDVLDGFAVGFHPGDVDFDVEMADVYDVLAKNLIELS